MAASIIVRIGGNIDDLKKALAEGKVQVVNTTSSINKLADALQGSKAKAEADKWAKAIEQIDGVTKLTAKDQERANQVMERAIEYYRAAGKEAPAAYQQIAAATRKAHEATTSLGDAVRAAGGAFGGFGSQAASAFSAFAAGAAGGGVVAGIGLVAEGLRALAGYGKSAIETGFQMNASLEKTTLQFSTLMGNADVARAHVADLFQIAATTPFETGPIIEASLKLQTFGGAALNTRQNILMLGDASAATAAPINELGFWVGRLYASLQGGQPFGESAMRLQELAILTPDVRQRMEELQKAGAGADQIFGIFTDSLGRFKGAMDLQAATWEGVTSTLSDSMKMLAADAFRPLFENVRDAVKAFNDFYGALSESGVLQTAANDIRTITGSLESLLGIRTDVGDNGVIGQYLLGKVSETLAALSLAKSMLQWATGYVPRTSTDIDLTPPGLIPGNALPPPGSSPGDKKAAEEIARLHAQLFGLDEIQKARQYAAALGDVANVSKLTADQVEGLHKAMAAAEAVFEASGRKVPAAIRAIYEATVPTIHSTETLAVRAAALAAQVPDMTEAAVEWTNAAIDVNQKGMAPLMTAIPKYSKLLEQADRPQREFVDTLGMIGGALETLADASGSTFAKMSAQFARFSLDAIKVQMAAKATAAAIDVSFAAATMGISLMASFVADAISEEIAWNESLEEQEAAANQATVALALYQQELLKTSDALKKVNLGAAAIPRPVPNPTAPLPSDLAQLQRITGVDLEALYKAAYGTSYTRGAGGRGVGAGSAQLSALQKGVEQAQTILAQMKELVGQYKVEISDLTPKRAAEEIANMAADLESNRKLLEQYGVTEESVLKKMAPAYDDLLQAALTTGSKLPASLQPVIEKLLEMGLVSDATKAKILGLAEPVDWQAMDQAAQKWGISADQMGRAYTEARTRDEMKSLFGDYELLVKGGVDSNVALSPTMSAALAASVKNAEKYGFALSADLQPLVQKLVDWGQLSASEVADLNFVDDVADPMDQLSTKIGDLFAPMDDLTKATIDLANAFRGGPVAEQPGSRAGGEVPAMAAGGIITRPTFALVGERGPEAVIPLDRLGAIPPSVLGAPGDGVALTANFFGVMNERWIRDVVMPGMLAVLRKGGGTLTDWRATLRE